ncbi:glycoside hydrolase family 73 protein [Agrobacterium tumefaciens]|uniref:glycoside hydrolase family 73 protein n=1 Tax=Agrobacterium tumefaciens TaxID=358 RepID=UPI0016594506|nr:glucosaminidase domain-containing protein [Agrobacterium tumefaciens]QNP80979.1 glucosaminidase domain-containing protein [Agrobacterium tumefaciens]
MKSRQDFYNEVYGYAKDAGLDDTRAHLAASQASLETGFGRSVAGNNYFGVKAGSSWSGPTKDVRTWEEVGGKRQNITDRFRAYEHPVQSLRDWASTVGNRWSSALSAPTFAEAVSALGAGKPGGYATDSKYGSKLNSIQSTYGKDVGLLSAIAPDVRNIPTPTARPEPTYTAPLSSVQRAPLQEVAMSPFDAGRFGPAPTSPAFDASRFASPDAVAQGKAALQRGLLDQQLNAGILPNIPPAVEEVQGYVDPRVSVQPSVSVTEAAPARSISQMTTGAVSSPQISNRQYEIAAQTQKDMRNRGILGTLGGAVLGGALLGPVGGLLGGYLGKTFSNSGYHPAAPERLNPNGTDDRSYGGLNDYGRDAYNESKDFRDAVDSKSSGLW